jgi:hypothetical protein
VREYIKHDVRITFSFQAYGQHSNTKFKSLVSSSQVPDVLIMETGPWDLYVNESIPTILSHTVSMLHNFRAVHNGLIVWLTIPLCPPFRDRVRPMNLAQRVALESERVAGPLLFLDRETSSAALNNTEFCEGFHTFRSVALLHRAMLLNVLCE